MDLKKVVVLSGLAIVMMATVQIVLAEEEAVMPTDTVTIPSNQQGSSQKESDMQWAWGEVANIDNQAQTVTLKYLDYETDQEKELVLVVDEKTVFENIKDFYQLKEKDTLSVDYMVGVDNKNIAKTISFENPDDSSSAPVPAENSQPVTPPSSTEPPAVDAVQPAASPEASAPAEPALAPDVQGQAQ